MLCYGVICNRMSHALVRTASPQLTFGRRTYMAILRDASATSLVHFILRVTHIPLIHTLFRFT